MIEAKKQRYLIGARVAVLAAFVVDGVGIGAFAASVPALRSALALTNSQLSLALLTFACGGITAMPIAGWLLSRVPSHRATAVMAAVATLSLLLPGIAPSLPLLVGATLVFGLCKGGLDVSMNTCAAAVQQAWGGPIMSSFHAAFSLGGLLGAGAMGLLFGQGCSVRIGLIVLTILVLPLIVVVAVFARAVGSAEQTPSSQTGKTASAFTWPQRALLLIGILCFLSMLIEGGMADWSGVYLATVAGASTSVATAGYAAFSAMMLIGRLGGDRVVRRFGEGLILRLGAALAVAGLTIGLSFATPGAAILGFALVGCGVSNIVPLLFTAGSRTATSPSVGIAVVATIGYSGFLVGPPAIGFTADYFGLRFALLLPLVGAGLVAFFAGRIAGGTRSTMGQTVAVDFDSL